MPGRVGILATAGLLYATCPSARTASQIMVESMGGPDVLKDHPVYEYLKDLNAGGFGFVQQARVRATGELVAIKFMRRGEGTITRHVKREILNHHKLLHAHIVQFREVFLTDTHLAIVMEFVEGGDLFTSIREKRGLSEADAHWYFQQLIFGLDYAHKMGVAFRDIKLENSLLTKDRRPLLKLCDFGYSVNFGDSVPRTAVGTPGYAAPEVMLGREYNSQLADIWSCGCMLYVMVFNAYPFGPANGSHRVNRQEVIQRMLHADYTIPHDDNTSSEFKDLLGRILMVDPRQRATIPEIAAHPWFKQILQIDLLAKNDEYVREQRQRPPIYFQSRDDLVQLVEEAKQVRSSTESEE